jgi:hypothetical protein
MKGNGRYRRSPWHGDDRGDGRLIRGLTSCFLTAEKWPHFAVISVRIARMIVT